MAPVRAPRSGIPLQFLIVCRMRERKKSCSIVENSGVPIPAALEWKTAVVRNRRKVAIANERDGKNFVSQRLYLRCPLRSLRRYSALAKSLVYVCGSGKWRPYVRAGPVSRYTRLASHAAIFFFASHLNVRSMFNALCKSVALLRIRSLVGSQAAFRDEDGRKK